MVSYCDRLGYHSRHARGGVFTTFNADEKRQSEPPGSRPSRTDRVISWAYEIFDAVQGVCSRKDT